MNEIDLLVKEDKSHPARFFLEAGGSVMMEIGVVATDYDNWSIVWAQSNGNCKAETNKRILAWYHDGVGRMN